MEKNSQKSMSPPLPMSDQFSNSVPHQPPSASTTHSPTHKRLRVEDVSMPASDAYAPASAAAAAHEQLDPVASGSKSKPSASTTGQTFDVLGWWKVNCNRFPVIANMARDILVIPISTVSSELAFSTGGRVITDHRSSLTTEMVQALICTQYWLKSTPTKILSVDELIEQEILLQELAQNASTECVPSIDLWEEM